jgi:two-component system NarL family sensor kinase
VPAAAGPLAVAIVIGAVVIERATRENPTTIDIAAAASLMALLVLRYWVLARAHGRETKQAHALAAELTEMHVRERAMRDRFMAEVVRARDEEARRIAEMLHDDAVQQLTALGLRLELAAISSGDETLDDLAASAGEVTASVRRLLIELHPAVLESQGLAPALTVASESLRATGVSVEVMRFDRRLAPETERLAYRLVQEALANAMKHARATAVRVEIAADERTLRCRVVDNGAGFHTAALSKGIVDGHFGLHLVRERVEHAGGRFLIESSPGGGTTFIIELPLARHAEAAAATA